MVRVRNSDSQGISRVRPSKLQSWQKNTEHGLNLLFFGFTGTNDRFLDEPRRIFGHGRAIARSAQQYHTARLPKLQRRLRVFVDEYLFDCGIIGAKMIEHRAELFVQKHEAIGQWQLSICFDFAIVDMRKTIAFLTDNAPTCCSKTGV